MAVMAALPALAAVGGAGGTLATALSIGGLALGAFGAFSQAQAGAASARYNAKVQERDAIVAEQNRQLQLRTSEIAAADKRRENRRQLAAIRAQYGASGLSLAGSPLDVLEDTAIEQELDVRRIEFEGRVSARGSTLESLSLREGAELDRRQGKSRSRAAFIGTAGRVLSGAGSVLSRTA